MRLAKLDRTNIINIFKYATKYMDDICWILLGIQTYFWTHMIPGWMTTFFWLYPLNIVEIKPQVIKYDANSSSRGLEPILKICISI